MIFTLKNMTEGGGAPSTSQLSNKVLLTSNEMALKSKGSKKCGFLTAVLYN